MHEEAGLIDLGGGVKRRILSYNEYLMTVEVLFETGAEGAAHTHLHTQCTYVLSGKFRYTVNGQAVDLGPGDSIVVDPGQVHGTLCLEKGVLLDVFTPKRADFLS
ncbi:MAG: cupin domain-containing protein [Clostridia bacterium]|nr:cupin domain-containing protein [Clostridia bacterium]